MKVKKNMKEYTGSVYVCTTGSDTEAGYCRDSIDTLYRRNGDSDINFGRGTKGYESRQVHLNRFMASNHNFIFLMDADQYFPQDALERLRSHKLPYISGLYLRRDAEHLAAVWYRPFTGKWPMEPWIGNIERGKLHPIGASGWGCMLLHREVVEAVRKVLKGENEVLEDDMDVYPYDLKRIMAAINGLRELADLKPPPSTLLPALEHHTKALEEEIVPLRADNETVGSDIRFPFFAKLAGYQLYGDPDVRCGHNINFQLEPDHLGQFTEEIEQQARASMHKRVQAKRRELQKQRKDLINARAIYSAGS